MTEVTPIPKLQPRKKQRRKIPDSVRAEVKRRSGGRCEVHLENGDRCQFDATQMHHKRRRSQGGEDTAANLLDTCLTHHGLIHQEPAWAVSKGYLIPTTPREPQSSALLRVSKVER